MHRGPGLIQAGSVKVLYISSLAMTQCQSASSAESNKLIVQVAQLHTCMESTNTGCLLLCLAGVSAALYVALCWLFSVALTVQNSGVSLVFG